jgi:HAD superfamily hydrolase (TIGR01490 family)
LWFVTDHGRLCGTLMTIIFFDFDRTLLAQNSASLWIRYELRAGRIGVADALKASLWLSLYHLGLSQMEEAIRRMVRSQAGKSAKEIQERSLHFYRSELRPLFRPGARQAVQQHREAGDMLVLLTTTTHFVAEAVLEDLALDSMLCNRLEISDDGNLTGRVQGTLCFGRGKLELARAFVQERNQSLSGTTFYTDSSSDLPMLEAVGRPVAVNPDPRLRREAKHRGWEVVDWGQP